MNEVFEPMHLQLPAFSDLLQPAGAFLKQASLLESDIMQQVAARNMKSTPNEVTAASSGSTSTHGESSFLIAMRKGLENLVQFDEEEEEEENDEDDGIYGGYIQKTIAIEVPPFYSCNYYSTITPEQVTNNSINQDDDLIFQMDM
jgi:hypothetical protein